MSHPPTRYSAGQFLALPDAAQYELRDGQLVPRPFDAASAPIVAHLLSILAGFVAEHSLGRVHDSSLALQPWPELPNTILRAGIAYISEDRLDDVLPGDICMTVPPDLVVEAVSATATGVEIEARVSEYLQAGVSLIWLLYPGARHIYVFRGDGTVTALWPGETLSGENILPGFELPLRDVFP